MRQIVLVGNKAGEWMRVLDDVDSPIDCGETIDSELRRLAAWASATDSSPAARML